MYFLSKNPERFYSYKEIATALQAHTNLIRSLIQKLESRGEVVRSESSGIIRFAKKDSDSEESQIIKEARTLRKKVPDNFIHMDDALLVLMIKELRKINGGK